MTVTCPSCSRSYQIAEEKLGGKAKRIRCRNCSEVFIIHPPKKKSETVEEPAPASRRTDERAARFARVLASDILVYNQDMVDKSRAEGNLAEVMAGDLKRSWDLWKSRFPEAAQSGGLETFRDALRKILAAGGTDFDDWVPED
jgi:predicted Zn finger-like uncharacterized protein